jgi:DNA-binding XRE family transcriptional regulator
MLAYLDCLERCLTDLSYAAKLTNVQSAMTKEAKRKTRIYHVRMAADLSQAEYADRIGVHPVTLSRLENGRIVPSHDLAAIIAKVTNRTPGQVIDEYLKHRRSA